MKVKKALLNAMRANPIEKLILNRIKAASKVGKLSILLDYKELKVEEETYPKLEFLGYGVAVSDKLYISWKPVYGFNGKAHITYANLT